MTLLHIDASILGANSASRQLSGAVVDRLRKTDPDIGYARLWCVPWSYPPARAAPDHIVSSPGLDGLDSTPSRIRRSEAAPDSCANLISHHDA